MPVLELHRIDSELRLWIPDRNVRIESRSELRFGLGQSCQARRTNAHPIDNLLERNASLARTSPHGGQRDLNRRNSAPRGKEITARFLHNRNTRRMVRR